MDISLYKNYTDIVSKIPRALTPMEMCDPRVRVQGDAKEVLYVAQLHLNLIKQTCEHLQKRHLTCFDPIVGENTCQVRGLHVIESSLDPMLLEEAQRVEKEAKEKLQIVNKLQSKLPPLNPSDSKGVLVGRLGVDIRISEKLYYCALSYFLTCGKYFQMHADGREVSGISQEILRKKLCKNIPMPLLGDLEKAAREQIAALTIPFIQAKAEPLGDAVSSPLSAQCIRVIKTPSHFHLATSVALCNFKTVLLTLERMQIPIVFTQHMSSQQPSPFVLAYKPREGETFRQIPFDQIAREEPVFQIEIFPNKEKSVEELGRMIEEAGVIDLALANIAVLPQYSEDDQISSLPKKTQEEILHYRKMGTTFGCLTDRPAIFRIAHTHASTKQEIKG